MNKSLKDVGGDALVVSQFTLAAETKGNRPGFSSAAPPDMGRKLYEHFLRTDARPRPHRCQRPVRRGHEGALVNDGPVTIWLDTDER
jgi:D-tyrosyl-tRNA(Tyr) deacylase